MKKKVILSSIAFAFMIGCGSGGNKSENSYENYSKISGKVIDGYVKNATICADLNKNLECDKTEPTTISDENGNYSLEVESKDFILISTGGIDTENNSEAIKMYSLPKYKNITPLTSLAVKEGEEKVIETFGINSSKIGADPMKDNEIKNIVKNIAELFKEKSTYQINILSQNLNENNKTEENITKEENNETSIKKKNANENIPPQILGDLTPPQIGETK